MTDSEPTEAQIKAARDAFREKCGITIYLPGEGTLDDFETERFEALVAALSAALSASSLLPQEGEIGVKKLEWIETGEDFIAGSVAGEYEILRTPEAWTAFRNGQGLSRHNNSPDDAKAAAQSDYEARILSALIGGDAQEDKTDGQ